MADSEMVTVFRSADDDAEADARAIQELLSANSIEAVLLDDSAPDVPSGAWEVQVPPGDSTRAEELIANAPLPDEDMVDVSDSPDFDTETVFRARSGTTSEMEALSVKGVLEASGIAVVMVGDSVLPNLAFEVRVAKDHAERARQVLADALSIGTQAADAEESATESPLNP